MPQRKTGCPRSIVSECPESLRVTRSPSLPDFHRTSQHSVERRRIDSHWNRESVVCRNWKTSPMAGRSFGFMSASPSLHPSSDLLREATDRRTFVIPSVVSSSVFTVAFSVVCTSFTPCNIPAESTSLRRVDVSSFTKRASANRRCTLPSAWNSSLSPTLRELRQRTHQRIHHLRRRFFHEHVAEVARELRDLLDECEAFLCVRRRRRSNGSARARRGCATRAGQSVGRSPRCRGATAASATAVGERSRCSAEGRNRLCVRRARRIDPSRRRRECPARARGFWRRRDGS